MGKEILELVPVDNSQAPPMTAHPKKRKRKSNEPSTAGGRERRLKARPPARFSSLRSQRLVNQKQEPPGNTLLAQRYPSSGNSYFWRKGPHGQFRLRDQVGVSQWRRRQTSRLQGIYEQIRNYPLGSNGACDGL